MIRENGVYNTRLINDEGYATVLSFRLWKACVIVDFVASGGTDTTRHKSEKMVLLFYRKLKIKNAIEYLICYS